MKSKIKNEIHGLGRRSKVNPGRRFRWNNYLFHKVMNLFSLKKKKKRKRESVGKWEDDIGTSIWKK